MKYREYDSDIEYVKFEGSRLKKNLSDATRAVNERPQWMQVGYHAVIQQEKNKKLITNE